MQQIIKIPKGYRHYDVGNLKASPCFALYTPSRTREFFFIPEQFSFIAALLPQLPPPILAKAFSISLYERKFLRNKKEFSCLGPPLATQLHLVDFWRQFATRLCLVASWHYVTMTWNIPVSINLSLVFEIDIIILILNKSII